MDFGAVYDQLGDGVTVGSLLETAAAFPKNLREHLETVFADNTPEDVVDRDVFIEIMAGVPTIKMTRLANLFDDMSIDGYITSDSLEHIFGVNAGLMVPDKSMVYDFDAFVENFGDLFDDDGDVRELPSTMIEQLKAINARIEALDGDVDHAQMERLAAEERLGTERRRHAAERDKIFEAAAAVEDERNSLYEELKDVRKQLAEKRREAQTPPIHDDPPEVSSAVPLEDLDDFEAAAAALVPEEHRSETQTPPIPDDRPEVPSAVPALEDFDDPEALDSDKDKDVIYSDIHLAPPKNDDGDPPPVPPYDGAAAWASAEIPVTSYCWFRDMNRREVEEFLNGTPIGTFIVRRPSRGAGYAMSIRKLSVVLHYRILETNGGYALHFVDEDTIESVGKVCATVAELVDYYRTVPINPETPLLVDPEK